MDKKTIKPLIPFLKKVEKKFKPYKVILFGSRARGDSIEDSDYDILIISDEFKEIDFYQRSAYAYSLKRGIPVSMDIICLTREEFNQRKKELGVVNQASKEGIDLLSINKKKAA